MASARPTLERQMHLTRCSDQRHATLEEFYGGSVDRSAPRGGAPMLELIQRLRALADDRQVYGLTSHDHLCLLAQDSYESPWFVSFEALDERNYFIEYRMPPHEAPWPGASVTGQARSSDEAVQMILTAMDRSGGWRSTASPALPPTPSGAR